MKENIISYCIQYLQTNGLAIIGRLFLGIAVFSIIYVLSQKIVTKIRNKIENENGGNDFYAKRNSKLTGSIVFIIAMIFNILAALQVMGFDAAIIMGGISLSLGFAMQSTIENLIAGIFILTNKKIKLGEFIQFMGPLNISGTIEEINIRYTVIRTFDKRRSIIPNSIVAKTPVRTLKSEPLLRGDIVFWVPRYVHISQIKKIFIDSINSERYILYPEYTTVLIDGFDTRGIHIKGFFFVNPSKKSPAIAARDIRKKLFESLKKYGIEIPYNHLAITVEK